MAKAVVQGGSPLENIHTFDGATTGDNIQSAVLVKEGTDTPLPSSTARGLVVDDSGSGVSDGRTTISTAGTPAQIGSSTACKAVVVTALPANTQRIAVGSSSCDAATSTFRGYPLEPLQSVGIPVNNVNLVYFDVLGDGHGVSWVAVT